MGALTKIGSKANPTVVIVAVGSVIALIVIAILILTKRTEKVNKYKIKRLSANAGGEIPEGWTPTAITNRLHSAIYSWVLSFGLENPFDSEYDKIADDILPLNDNQKIDIYNDWNDRFFKEDDETLVQAMNGEVGSPSLWGKSSWQIMIDEYEAMNLP